MTSYNPDKVEKQVKQEWQQNNTRKKSLKQNKDKKRFYFLDGPPYASGNIHMGTGLNKILKDFYLRFHRKLGYNVHSQPGYDTHGLPIENKVEEEKGFNSKKDIEDFGVENFINECQAFVDQHIEKMNKDFEDIGVWMDFENPYVTYHDYYIEGAWQTFKKAYEKEFLYEDQYPVHICTRCETAVAYNEIEYANLEDPEVYVALKLQDSDEELLIWTTTPWTLPANTAVMMHPDFKYSLIEFNDRKIWMASELTEQIMNKFGYSNEDYQITEEKSGSEFEGLTYNHPLEENVPAQKEVQGKVVLTKRYVDLEGGTGLVHSAPGHGKEDYEVGQKENLDMISPVDLKGQFTEEAGKYEGLFVKDADNQIKEDLGENLLHASTIHHEYPQCWRCDTPLLQLSIPQWFFGATQFREELLENNDEVNWIPSWSGQKFKEWLEQLGDWPVSRQRYWGIPLPIWECDACNNTKVIGDRSELPEVPEDLHRPYIDNVTLECDCGEEMERIPDVLDVWFDSGVAPWASLKNPDVDFNFEDHSPVDLELEGFDQIRGWWNSQFITSHMTYEQKPFNNVIYHGKVMLDGEEMSKSRGIVVSPEEAVEKYGRDILRFFLLSNDPSDDLNFTWDKMEENKEFMNILWNTYNYRDTYTEKREKPERLETEDKWILSKLNTVIEDVRTHSTEPNFEGFKAAQALEDFTKNDLSRGYIKMIRDRLRPGYDKEDRKSAEWTLRYVTEELLKALSPFTPYLTEHLYTGSKSSIHFEPYPESDESMINADLERSMEIFQDVEEAVARLRQDKGVKLRHPVRKVTVSGSEEVKTAVTGLDELLKERLNAKDVAFEKVEPDYEVKLDYSNAGPILGSEVGNVEKALKDEDHKEIAEKIDEGITVDLEGHKLEPEMFEVRTHVPEGVEGEEFSSGTVYLDDEMTSELEDEAFVAEVIRAVQQKRKEAELDVEDSVNISFEGETRPIESRIDEVLNRMNVSEINYDSSNLEHSGKVEFKGRKILFSFSNPV